MTRRQFWFCEVLFGIYLMVCGWIILFHGNLGTLDILFDPDFRVVSFDLYFNGRESLLNVLLFVPFGVYAGLFGWGEGLWGRVARVLLGSLAFEAAQYILAVGTSDVMDLINNTLGGVVGMGIYMGFRHALGERVYAVLLPLLGIGTVGMVGIAMVIGFC